MASSDARPVPRKNTAFRVTFPIFNEDGDLLTGATGLDSERSLDGGTFADCTNEATEIAASSGVYYLDLTASEMNADTVAIMIKSSSVGAKTTVLVLYPEEAGDTRLSSTFETTITNLGQMLVDDGGTHQFTAHALEQTPQLDASDFPLEQRRVSEYFTAIIPNRKGNTSVVSSSTIRIKTSETVTCAIDFTQILATGDRLSSIVSLVKTSAEALTLNVLGVDRELAKFTVAGGVAGESYTIIATVTTAFGNTLEGEFTIVYTT